MIPTQRTGHSRIQALTPNILRDSIHAMLEGHFSKDDLPAKLGGVLQTRRTVTVAYVTVTKRCPRDVLISEVTESLSTLAREYNILDANHKKIQREAKSACESIDVSASNDVVKSFMKRRGIFTQRIKLNGPERPFVLKRKVRVKKARLTTKVLNTLIGESVDSIIPDGDELDALTVDALYVDIWSRITQLPKTSHESVVFAVT